MQLITRIQSRFLKYFSCKKLIFIGLILIFSRICFELLRVDLKENPWVLGDWLINYQDGGFKRRGLSGSFFFLLQDVTGISLNYLVYFVQLFFYFVFFKTFYQLISDKQITIRYFIFIFSPITFLFLINYPGIVGRKEIILLTIFSLVAKWITQNSYSKKKEIFILISLFISMFFHELTFFYFPYFIILKVAHTKSKELKIIDLKNYFFYFLVVFIPFILFYLLGTEINNGKSIEILFQRGIKTKGGIFTWNKNSIDYVLHYKFHYLLFLIPLLYGTFLFLINYCKKKFTQLIYLVFLSFVFSLPLFVLAIDWGRWLFIHFTLILIIVGSLLKENTQYDENFKQKDFLYLPLMILNVVITFPHFNKGIMFGSSICKLINKLIQ